MAATYRVERSVNLSHGSYVTEFAIIRTGEGELVRGNDPVLLYRITDLLNEEVTHETNNQRTQARPVASVSSGTD